MDLATCIGVASKGDSKMRTHHCGIACRFLSRLDRAAFFIGTGVILAIAIVRGRP